MDIVVEQRAPTTVVRITGSVDGLTADTLMATLQQQIDALAGCSAIVSGGSSVASSFHKMKRTWMT